MSQIRTKIKFKYKDYLIFSFFTINIQCFDLELDTDEFDVLCYTMEISTWTISCDVY